MYKVGEWPTVFSSFVKERASYTQDLPDIVTEMALVSVLMNDVGGDVEAEDGTPAYDIHEGNGTFIHNNTGKVFSVAADWKAKLPAEAQEKMEQLPAYRALIESVLAYRSVPFEIACMNKLSLSRDMIEALGKLALDLSEEGELSKLVRNAFLVAFDNPLVADKEYDLFKQRVVSCATARKFSFEEEGAIGNYGNNLQKVVQSGTILQYLNDPGQLHAV